MSPTYRTLDLVRAASFGWSQQHDLSQSEYQVLQFIALRGKSNEPGNAYAWFPKYGQEWWADIMSISHNVLRKTLSRLRKKGLIVNINGSADERFTMIKGYGIPEHVMEECKQWYEDRQDMVYTQVPNTIEELDENVTCGHIDVTCGHMHVTSGHIDNAVTCGNTLHTHVYTREKTQLLTDRSRSSISPTQTEDSMRYEDEWSIPKESRSKPTRSKSEVDDFSVPREAKEKAAPVYGPNMRLTQQFHKCWMVAREKRLNLAVDWSVQKVFMARMKALLETHTEEQISEMIDIFFRLVDSGQVPLKADELWKDFWYNRGRLQKIATQSSDKPAVANDEKSELERFRERMNR